MPAVGSIKFAYELRDKHGSSLHFTLRPSEEHLFDTKAHADQEWVQNGRSFVEKYWPAGGTLETLLNYAQEVISHVFLRL